MLPFLDSLPRLFRIIVGLQMIQPEKTLILLRVGRTSQCNPFACDLDLLVLTVSLPWSSHSKNCFSSALDSGGKGAPLVSYANLSNATSLMTAPCGGLDPKM